MKNMYKRLDVFRCNQESHHAFNGRVSVYHVLREKQCHPQGCLYFLWHCARMAKGEKCIKKYNFVGKNCRGCTHYLEEKVHLQPECTLSGNAFDMFEEALETFETWLDEVRYKRLPISGTIHLVKPWFEQELQHQSKRSNLRGYLLVIKKGFIGMTPFEDTFYIRISERLMRQFQFLPKMRLDLIGEVREDRGRIVIHRPGRFEIHSKGRGKAWTHEKALVAMHTATRFNKQPDTCLQCPFGILVDTQDNRSEERRKYRSLLCMNSMADPEICYIKSKNKARRRKQSQGSRLVFN